MTEDWRDEDACCPCCCTCFEPEPEVEVGPPEPYQLWLIAEWAPKDFNEILKRYYAGPIAEFLNQPSLIWEILALAEFRDRQAPLPFE
jgi:hypothetical protein